MTRSSANQLTYPTGDAAAWNLRLADDSPEAVEDLRRRVEAAADAAQYGWGHTIDFGAFQKEGLLGDKYLRLVGVLDELGWLPADLTGTRMADVGCYTGGISALFASRGARVVAVDELASHTEQCQLIADAFDLTEVSTEIATIYNLEERHVDDPFDIVFVGGVLYHLSDMLAGLIACRRALKEGGRIIVETNAVENMEESYANFGRFFGGMWWQPTGLCVQDLMEFAGFEQVEVRFYQPGRCVAVGTASGTIDYRRGVNAVFPVLEDEHPRTLDPGLMRPAGDWQADAGMLKRWIGRRLGGLLRVPMRLGYFLRHRR